LQVRPLHCAARELRAAFSEWPVSLPTCGLKLARYGRKTYVRQSVRHKALTIEFVLPMVSNSSFKAQCGSEPACSHASARCR